jgi:UDP-N-acetylglucosamine 2-epimerase (non-hydrolysing)
VAAGTVKVIGMDEADIVREASRLLDDHSAYEAMASRANPYGDGTARVKIVARILQEYPEPAGTAAAQP